MRSSARLLLPLLPSLVAGALHGEIPLRVGLDTQATEWIIALEGGGQVCTRAGLPLLALKDGEKLRIWWDAKGEARSTDEYRIQVGMPVDKPTAEARMAQLRAMGEKPERLHVADGDSWRVLLGHFATAETAAEHVPSLNEKGFDEVWISTEKVPGLPASGRALYAITERYERRALPMDGISFIPKGELTTVQGKGRYRGRMEIFPNAQGRLSLVNSVELETYLRGVVPKEMGAWEFPAIEALKVQAVAARTYAVANRGKRSKDGFDLVDTVSDQVYGGRDGEQALTDRAIEETKGLVAMSGGRPIQALFMANCGGATTDNRNVFGGEFPYLKPATNYLESATTLPFKGEVEPVGEQRWLSWELLRLAALDLVPSRWMDDESMNAPVRISDLQPILEKLTQRLHLAPPEKTLDRGSRIYLWMARCLDLDQVVEGMERPQDAAYYLGGHAELDPREALLAGFLVRRGIVSPQAMRSAPSLAQALQALARMWQELEPMEVLEGTLLRDGQVRVKNGGPGPLALAPSILMVEEAPNGGLRLVGDSAIQVGDRIKWMARLDGSRVLVRRIDPDGASLDRYNPTAHWKLEIKESDLLDKLKQKGGITTFQSFSLKHDANGRVLEMSIRDGAGRSHTFTGMRIRNLLGLKDNVFRFIQVGESPNRRYIFFGRGWGHGVGMDQTGAYGYALEGWTFDRILKHYYQGIELKPVE